MLVVRTSPYAAAVYDPEPFPLPIRLRYRSTYPIERRERSASIRFRPSALAL